MLKDVLKVFAVLVLPFVLFIPVASCIEHDNTLQRERQMQECKARGGTYSRSFEPNASPYRDSCVT